MSTPHLPSPASHPPRSTEVSRHTLDNGLSVLIEPLHHAPVVALQAWVHVGGADEDKEHDAGLAHLHEHMLFKGTERRAVGEVARTVEAVGGEINAWTSHDDTVYHMVLGNKFAGLGLDLLADVLRSSNFDGEELAREREVVLEEIRRAEDSPARRLSSALFRLAFKSHPYRDPVLGTSASVAATSREHMLAFFRSYYRPDNVTLLIVGDVVPDEVMAEVNKLFGSWQPDSRGTARTLKFKRQRTTEASRREVAFEVLAEKVEDAHISLAWPAPPAKHDDTAALDVFGVLLGHGDSSRLHEALVRPRQVRDAYASCYTPRDPGLMFVGATLNDARPEAEQVLSVVEQLTTQALKLAERPPSNQELDKARALTLADVAYSRQTMEGQARKRGFYESTCSDFAHEESYLDAIRALEGPQICEAARRWLAEPPAVILQVPDDSPKATLKLDAQAIAGAIERAKQAARKVRRGVAKRQTGEHGFVKLELPHGPRLLVRSQPGGTIALRAVAPGGQRWETRHEQGLGLLTSSVWAQRTQERPSDALAALIARMGGSLGAFCGRNTLGLSGEFIAEHLQAGVELFYEALFSPQFDDADLARERFAQAERLRARKDSPGAVASELFGTTLFAHHPYGLSALGTAESLERISVDSLRGYHARHTRPEDLVISVVGPVDIERLLEWTSDAITQRFRPSDVPALGKQPPELKLDTPPTTLRRARQALDKQQSHVLVGSMGTTFAQSDRFALEVMCAVLSGQSGRLFMDLRDRQSLAYSLAAGSVEGVDPGHVVVHMASAPDKVERALEGVHGHLQRLIDEPVGDEEMSRARELLAGGHAIDLQRPGAQALSAATGELYGLGFESFAQVPEQVRAVSAGDVQRVAKQYLAQERRVEVVVGPGV